MKGKILFECEFCNTLYACQADVISCENNHKKIKAIDKVKYLSEKKDSSGYPHTVILLMENGQKIEYKR